MSLRMHGVRVNVWGKCICVLVFNLYACIMRALRCVREFNCMNMYGVWWACMHVWVCISDVCIRIICVWLRGTAMQTYLVRFRFGNRRFGFVSTVDPIYWRFEDRSIGWSGDSYWFVQWRSDGDSVSKSHYFMWMFALVLFSCLLLSRIFIFYSHHFMWLSDIFY